MWKLKGDCAELALERGYMLRESGHQSGLIGAKAMSNALLTMFVDVGKVMGLIQSRRRDATAITCTPGRSHLAQGIICA